MNISTSQKKKGLTRDKVEIENAKMRIIKWETILNNNGKLIFTTTVSRNANESKIVVTAKPKRISLLTLPRRTHNHNISLKEIWNYKLFLCNKNEFQFQMIRDFCFYFSIWRNYKFKWLGIFIFIFIFMFLNRLSVE